MSALSSLSAIRVVLVGTSHPGNIGSAARAMKTMGLAQLCLVNPERFPHPDAMAMAANADDVLGGAALCKTLDAALEGTVLQIAFSARHRALSHSPLSVRDATREAVSAAATQPTQKVALVFGNETYGLSNGDVMRCNRLATIPTDPACSSLNLAAAVQIAAYELRLAATASMADAPAIDAVAERAPHEEVERFIAHLERSIYASGFLQPNNPRRLMERMRRLFARAGLEKEEINIWRGMLAAWDELARKSRGTDRPNVRGGPGDNT